MGAGEEAEEAPPNWRRHESSERESRGMCSARALGLGEEMDRAWVHRVPPESNFISLGFDPDLQSFTVIF